MVEQENFDGFNTILVLDCGCKLRLNDFSKYLSFGLGDWFSCPSGLHSAIYKYDSSDGSPVYNRDRKVVRVLRKEEE